MDERTQQEEERALQRLRETTRAAREVRSKLEESLFLLDRVLAEGPRQEREDRPPARVRGERGFWRWPWF